MTRLIHTVQELEAGDAEFELLASTAILQHMPLVQALDRTRLLVPPIPPMLLLMLTGF